MGIRSLEDEKQRLELELDELRSSIAELADRKRQLTVELRSTVYEDDDDVYSASWETDTQIRIFEEFFRVSEPYVQETRRFLLD